VTTKPNKAVTRLFLSVLEQPKSEREALLAEIYARDVEQCKAVKKLLVMADSASRFFDEFENELLETQLNELENYGSRGVLLGNYELLHLIAQGGMGAVFMARRADGQFERMVVIKMLPMDLQDEELQKRFKSERKLLANLQHSNIAQLFDAGITDDGRAYFVMEYVSGQSITDYCHSHRLSIMQRLSLFQELLAAVQYAHQNLVVHQDIKPSNVMVDDGGHVKLLDFGIASTLSEVNSETPEGLHDFSRTYAAPEQLQGKAITTATDTHQLGQLLFELLTGIAPSSMGLATVKQNQQVLLQWWDASFRRDAQRLNAWALSCGESPSSLRKCFSGDLDAIVSHALQAEPSCRYVQVSLMVRDIQAMRSNYPVSVRKPTAVYRTGRLVRRNRLLSAGVLLLVLVLVAFSAVTYWQEKRTAQERDRAVKVMDLLVDIFDTTSPTNSPGEDLSATEILERGAEKLPQKLAGEPDIQADLLEVIGRAQQNLGKYRQAQNVFDLALAISDKALIRSNTENARLLLLMAENDRLLNNLDVAERKVRRAMELLRNQNSDQYPHFAEAMGKLGRIKVLQGKLGEARDLLQQTAELELKQHGKRHVAYPQALNDLASVSFAEGDFSQAEILLRESLEIREALLDDPVHRNLNTDYATNINNLGLALFRQGKLQAAEPLFRKAIKLRQKIYLRPHPEQAQSLTNLGLLLNAQGRVDEALPVLRRALEIRLEAFGAKHMRVAEAQNNLGMLYLSNAQFEDALSMYRSAAVIVEHTFGQEHSTMATVLNNMAQSNLELGNYELALTEYSRSLEIRKKTLPAEHLFLSYSQVGLGRALTATGKFEKALVYLQQGLALREKKLPPDHWLIGEAQFALAEALEGVSRKKEAQKLARSALRILKEKKGAEHYFTKRVAAFLEP
jgi:serine/threonine-protein kinase